MFRKVITLSAVLLIPFLCLSQASREKSAMKDLSKHRWDKAHGALMKTVRKDSINAPAYYGLARYFFDSQNPGFQLDSAYKYTLLAIRQWNQADARTRARWSKLPLDSAALNALKAQVEHEAFAEASRKNSEEGFDYFLKRFTDASERATAIDLRHEVAFRKAVETNTFSAFQTFIEKYPDARQVPEARARYEELLYAYATQDNRLESFASFLKNYPESPYRRDAERNIFHQSTADGSTTSFIDFLNLYPDNAFAKTARDILYHLLVEEHLESSLPKAFVNDSIASLDQLRKEFLVPFFTNGKFGFMSPAGKEIIPAKYNEIADDYRCGNINEDVLVLDGKILTRRGELLLNQEVISLEDTGYGFLKVELRSGTILLHKSGLRIGDFDVERVSIVSGRLLAIKTGGQWGVFSFTGKRLIPFGYDDIFSIGNLIVFEKEKKFKASTPAAVAAGARAEEVFFTEEFDEVKKMGDNLWVRTGDLQGVINQDLKMMVKPDLYAITPAFFGAVVMTDTTSTIYNQFGEASELFDRVEVKEPWVAAKSRGNGWMLYDPQVRISKSIPYDSIAIHGPFAVGMKHDGIEINLQKKPNFNVILNAPQRIEFLPGQDSVSFLLIEQDKKQSVYDQLGNKLYTVSYDRIQYAGNGFFVVSKKEKKGLINTSGKLILPIEYDAIGTAANGMISLLKAMKFGLFDTEKNKLIKPAYDKNIQRYSDKIFTAFKDGLLGFIDENSKVIGKFEFSEIKPWRDSVALAKQNGTWRLYNIYTQSNVMTGIREFKPLRDTQDERLYSINHEGQVGVMSNRRGVVIPLKFSDVVNVGSVDLPVYFTEKHVAEASIFVVIYYDQYGKLIRKEIYEPDDYEMIFCD